MPKTKEALFVAGLAGAVGLTAAAYWQRNFVGKPPQLYFGPGGAAAALAPRCSLLQQPYQPTPWAVNKHVQTIVGLLRRASIAGNYRRQLLVADDGGTLALDWFDHCDAKTFGPDDTPILLVLHGINGGSHEGYCKWVCAAACSHGWRAVVLNYRGCNGLPLTSPRGYSATLSDDVRLAVESIASRFPATPLMAVGYSLGSVVLTKYLAEADSGHSSGGGSGSGLVAACLVSNPVSLEGSTAAISRPWSPSFVYNLAVVFKLREYVHTHRDAISRQTQVDMGRVLNSWTVQAFEEATMLRDFGFRSRQEYYREASSLRHLPAITTPTLVLLSADDPFLGAIPIQECSRNPATVLAVTQYGGHVAFLKGIWPFGQAWMDDVVLQFLDQALQLQRQASAAAGATAVAAPPLSRELALEPLGQGQVLLGAGHERPKAAVGSGVSGGVGAHPHQATADGVQPAMAASILSRL